MAMHLPFIYSLLVILLVYGLKKAGLFKAGDSAGFSKVVMNFTFPAVILYNISTTELSFDLVLIPLLPIGMALTGAGLGSLFFRKFPARTKGLLMLSTVGLNIGLFAFPIIEGLFGAEGLKIAAIMDMGNAFMIFSLSYYLGAYYSPVLEQKRRNPFSTLTVLFKSPPFITYLIALGINLSGLMIPPLIMDWVSIFSRANQFMVLLVLGLMLNFDWKLHGSNGVIRLLLLRYFTALIFALVTWFFLPLDPVVKKVTIICMTLPAGFLVIPYAYRFGYDEHAASGIINLSLVLGFFSMWGLMIFL